jgi:glycosyltransferase involved in cell wall biosynthesis
MRIGINARFLIKNKLEGLGWYTYQVIQRIVSNHPEHEYFLFFDRKPDDLFLFGGNIQAICLRPAARHPVLWWLWFDWLIPSALKKYRIDVFLSLDGYASLRSEIPQVIVIHDLAFEHYPEHLPYFVKKYYQYFVPKQIKKSTQLIAVSQATKKDIIDKYGIASEKISIAYNGVREEFKSAGQMEKNKFKQLYAASKEYFLFVGAMHPRKNIYNLIKAFDLFKKTTNSEYKLILVGRKAWHTNEIEFAINKSEFKSDIIVYSYFTTEKLAQITAGAFCAINPSLLEGFGVPVLEALVSGVPVLISNRFSLPEVGGPGALCFNPEDISDISEQMYRSVNDPERDRRISLGFEHSRKFNWNETAELIYSKIIESIKN